MRILVAGASGAIGTRLVAQLVDNGYEVVGTHRNPANAARVSALGAVPVQLDLLDPAAVRAVDRAAAPDAIVHQATALSDMTDFKHFDRSCGRRAPTRCSPPRGRRACGASSPRASPAPATSAPAGP